MTYREILERFIELYLYVSDEGVGFSFVDPYFHIGIHDEQLEDELLKIIFEMEENNVQSTK